MKDNVKAFAARTIIDFYDRAIWAPFLAWVSDRENNRVQMLDRDGRWLGEIGGLYKPMAIEPAPDGGFLVSDHTPRLSLFSAEGKLVGRCRTFGTVGHGLGLRHSDGSIFVAEMGPDMLTRLAPLSGR